MIGPPCATLPQDNTQKRRTFCPWTHNRDLIIEMKYFSKEEPEDEVTTTTTEPSDDEQEEEVANSTEEDGSENEEHDEFEGPSDARTAQQVPSAASNWGYTSAATKRRERKTDWEEI
ncbi:unnamed protein product [Caenorhabditis nigoni]